MNLILLFPKDFLHDDRVKLTDERRVKHIINIHQAAVGDTLSVGMVNGKLGTAEITQIEHNAIYLTPSLNTPPPPALEITLILGLPRPQMLKRTLQNISCLGIKRCILLHSHRVEKSYWQSPRLQENQIQHELVLGLEQGCDTRLPIITFAKRFTPFIEDILSKEIKPGQALVAHPYAKTPCPTSINNHIYLAVGPEGGFIVREIEQLAAIGFEGITLGPRILRVETVIPYLAGRLSG